MKSHPMAELFPLMEGDEFKSLVDDVRTNGVREPITILDGQILDGRNRFRACEEVGISCPQREYEGDVGEVALSEFVFSLNYHRRNLDATQRAIVSDSIAQIKHGSVGRPKKDVPRGTSSLSQEEAAEVCGSSRRSVIRARKVRESGTPSLLAAAKAGKVQIKLAEQVARQPEDFQERFVAKVLAGVKPTQAVKEVRNEDLPNLVLPVGKHRVILADPPWQYGDERVGIMESSAADHHYPTMPLADICAMDVKSIAADDAVLFCWATFPLLPEALEVVKAWGFKYKTAIVWDKVKANFGNYHRADAELLIIATRGSCVPENQKDKPSQVVSIERTEHSRKPDEFYDLIEGLYKTGPHVELFARRPRNGWKTWGNQA